jgi:hypothetical protein
MIVVCVWGDVVGGGGEEGVCVERVREREVEGGQVRGRMGFDGNK